MKYVVKVDLELLIEASVTVSDADSPEQAQEIAKKRAEDSISVQNDGHESVYFRVKNMGVANTEIEEKSPEWEKL